MPNIELIQADITELCVDAIVNAANPTLLGGGGVDGAIHRAAGPELLAFCRTLGGCETGDAKISPGFMLKAKWVIHTVGPIYSNSERDPILLSKCVFKCMTLALQQECASVAFPAISTGVYGYPKNEAAKILLLSAIKALEQERCSLKVMFCLYSKGDFEIFSRVLNQIENLK